MWLTATLLTVAAAAPSATAETHADKDPRGDVVRTVPGEGRSPTRAANGDIVRHRITYGDKRLVAVIRFAKLTKKARILWVGLPVRYRNGADLEYADVELVIRRKGPRQPRAAFHVVGDPVKCHVDSRVAYDRDLIRFTVPAACMGSPRWVRAYTAAYRTDDLDEPSYFLSDSSPNRPRGGVGPRIEQG